MAADVDDTQATIRLGLKMSAAFSDLAPTISVAGLRLFLEVADQEGLTMSEYARRSGYNIQSTSRILLDLTDAPRKTARGVGYGLLVRSPGENLREVTFVLSAGGRTYLRDVVRAAARAFGHAGGPARDPLVPLVRVSAMARDLLASESLRPV